MMTKPRIRWTEATDRVRTVVDRRGDAMPPEGNDSLHARLLMRLLAVVCTLTAAPACRPPTQPADGEPELADAVGLPPAGRADALTPTPGDDPIPSPLRNELEPRVFDALMEARQAVVKSPESAEAWGLYGELLDAHVQVDAAETCYRRAAALDPEALRWVYLLARLVHRQGGRDADALALYERCVGIDPAFPTTYYRRGRLLKQMGRASEAGEEFKHALRLQPDFAAARRELASVLVTLGDPETAIHHLNIVARDHPEDRHVQAALAKAYTVLGDATKAHEAADKARELELTVPIPDPYRYTVRQKNISGRTLRERGFARVKQGDYRGAADDLALVVETFPEDAAAHVQLGRAYMHLQEKEKARRHLAQAVALEPDRPVAQLELGGIYLRRRQLDRALVHLQKARELDPDNPIARLQLAACLGMNGRLDEAEAELQAAADLDPTNPVIVMNLGNVHLGRGRPQQALEQFRSALELDPGLLDAHFNAGLALEQLGRIEEAIRHYAKAKQADPNHPAARRLTQLHTQKGG